MTTQKSPEKTRQALLLFTREYQREQKNFGFGRRMDKSVHLAMLNHTFGILRQINNVDIYIVKDGHIPHLEGARYLEQRGDDFNSRFRAALEDTFKLGYQRIVVIGGDTPTLQANDLRIAFNSDEIVVGPTRDGGFYLAAMSKSDVALFDQLPWRQNQLFDVLRQRIDDRGSACRQLPLREDIDQHHDARKQAPLLMLLVKRWLNAFKVRFLLPQRTLDFPVNKVPEPRFHSLPPPFHEDVPA